ncbi:hypothetical protein [Silicibacter phage DSS3phi2]|uniref:Uncharacterized protein n=1 Tax=Silicibacter phage DSS3phi2 TaxID=490912 RepID=C4NT11_9CAUD|nr:hypothetical protein DSS3P2_gp09 [Silicibacter phage DSS3phi2]ACL81277.1 hypothetical protein [Silicibacter phage DSS3phi2]
MIMLKLGFLKTPSVGLASYHLDDCGSGAPEWGCNHCCCSRCCINFH